MAIYPSKTIRLKAANVIDLNKVLITNPTSVTLTVWDSTNAQQLQTTGVTNDLAGNYYYDYTLPGNAIAGTWKYEFKVVNGSYVDIEASTFPVVPLPPN